MIKKRKENLDGKGSEESNKPRCPHCGELLKIYDRKAIGVFLLGLAVIAFVSSAWRLITHTDYLTSIGFSDFSGLILAGVGYWAFKQKNATR